MNNKGLETSQTLEIDQAILCKELGIDPSFFDKARTQADQDWGDLDPTLQDDLKSLVNKPLHIFIREGNPVLERITNEDSGNLQQIENVILHTAKDSEFNHNAEKLTTEEFLTLLSQKIRPFQSQVLLHKKEWDVSRESFLDNVQKHSFLFYYNHFFPNKKHALSGSLKLTDKDDMLAYDVLIKNIRAKERAAFKEKITSPDAVSDQNYASLLSCVLKYSSVGKSGQTEKFVELFSHLLERESWATFSLEKILNADMFKNLVEDWCNAHQETLRNKESEVRKIFLAVFGEIESLSYTLQKIILTPDEFLQLKKEKKQDRKKKNKKPKKKNGVPKKVAKQKSDAVAEVISTPEDKLCKELGIDPHFFDKLEIQAEEDWEDLKSFLWDAVACLHFFRKREECSDHEASALEKLISGAEENFKKLQNVILHTRKGSANSDNLDRFTESNALNLVTTVAIRGNIEMAISEMEERPIGVAISKTDESQRRLSIESEALIVRERLAAPFLFYYQDFLAIPQKRKAKKKSTADEEYFEPHREWVQSAETKINDAFLETLASENVLDENYLSLLTTILSYEELEMLQKGDEKENVFKKLEDLISLLLLRETRAQFPLNDVLNKFAFREVWKEWCKAKRELLRDENSETHKVFLEFWGGLENLPLFLKKIIFTKNELNPQKQKNKKQLAHSAIRKAVSTVITPAVEATPVCETPQIEQSGEKSLNFVLQNPEILNDGLFLQVKLPKKPWMLLEMKENEITLEGLGIKPDNHSVLFRFGPDINVPVKEFPPTESFSINVPKPERVFKPTPTITIASTTKKVEAVIEEEPTPESTRLELSPEEDAMEMLALELMENGNKRKLLDKASFDWTEDQVRIEGLFEAFNIENLPIFIIQYTPEVSILFPLDMPKELKDILIPLIKKEKERREIEQVKLENPELVTHLNTGNKTLSTLNQWQRENPEKELSIFKKGRYQAAKKARESFSLLRNNYASFGINLSLDLQMEGPYILTLKFQDFEIKIPFENKGIDRTTIETNAPHTCWKKLLTDLGCGVIAQIVTPSIPPAERPKVLQKSDIQKLLESLQQNDSRIVRYDEEHIFHGANTQDETLEELLERAHKGEKIEVLIRDENINFPRGTKKEKSVTSNSRKLETTANGLLGESSLDDEMEITAKKVRKTITRTPKSEKLRMATEKLRTQKYLILRLLRTAKDLCPGYPPCPEDKQKTKIYNPKIQAIALQTLQNHDISSWKDFIEHMQEYSPGEFLKAYPTLLTSLIDALIDEDFKVTYESAQTINILTFEELSNAA